jgi:hypothetical protein
VGTSKEKSLSDLKFRTHNLLSSIPTTKPWRHYIYYAY